MTSDADDPFLVTSPLGIRSVLRTLVVQNTLVHMRLEQESRAIITTLLDVDSDQERIVVDAAADERFNQRLVQAPAVYFDAQVNRVRVQFHISGHATPYVFDQRSAFLLPYPRALRRLQRRDHFRIEIPVSTPLSCIVPVKAGKDIELPVRDISAGGIALLDRNNSLSATAGALLPRCSMDLDGIGTVVVNLRIRRVEDQVLADGKTTRVVACQFDHCPQPDTIRIQNYIGRLERMLNARRRGFD